MGYFPSLLLALVLILAVLNVALNLHLTKGMKTQAMLRHPPLSTYTFIDEDYPAYLPLSLERPSVGLVLEDSVHYAPGQPEAALEWAYTGPVGDSNVRLGPTDRFFNTAFSYQLHCARYLVSAFERVDAAEAGDAHLSRCLNVLRQFVLCSADTTLEPPDSMSRNVSAVRGGGERRCRDWPALYATMEQNWAEWRAAQDSLQR